MKKLITIFILGVMSSVAIADQLIFSQYDGVNSWENIYIEVQDAKAYPGAFIDGVPGTVNAGVQGKAGVAAKLGSVVIEASWHWDHQPDVSIKESVSMTPKTKDTYTVYMSILGRGSAVVDVPASNYDYPNGFAIQVEALKKVASTFKVLPGATEETFYSNIVEPTEEEEEVIEVKPTREDPQVRRTIVSVPEGIDINAFITEFLK